MPEHSFQGMEILTSEDVARITAVTDSLGLHRDWVVVPIDTIAEGLEFQQPDGKIVLHAPGKDRFEAWLLGLRGRLQGLNLGMVPRPDERDPKAGLTGPFGFKAIGTRRYLGSLGVLN